MVNSQFSNITSFGVLFIFWFGSFHFLIKKKIIVEILMLEKGLLLKCLNFCIIHHTVTNLCGMKGEFDLILCCILKEEIGGDKIRGFGCRHTLLTVLLNFTRNF